MSGSNNKLSKIYDFRSVGAGNAISDIKKINEQLQQSVDLKKKLNDLMNKSSDGSSSRKYKTEVENVEKAEGKLVVKMNDRIRSTMKLAKHNKELQLEIKHVADEIGRTTDALNEQNKAEVKAIQEAQAYYKTQQQVTKETEKRTQKTRDLIKETLEAKIIEQDRIKSLKNQIREELNAKGSLENRRAALIRLTTAYDRLSPKEKDTAWGQRTKKVVTDLTAQVKLLEAETGRSQRNVGNYASGWGGVAQKAEKAFGVLRTIANVLPGFGIGGLVGLGVDGLISLAQAMGLLKDDASEAISILDQLTKTFDEFDARTEFWVNSYEKQAKLLIAKANLRGASIQEVSQIEQDAAEKSIQAINEQIAAETEALSGYTRVLNLKKAGAVGIAESEADIQKSIDEGNKRISKLQQQRSDMQIDLEVKTINKQKELKDKQASEDKKRQDESLRDERERARSIEEINAINFQNKINLISSQAAEIEKRARQYESEIQKMDKAGYGNKKLAEESYQKDIAEIQAKYHLQHMRNLEAWYDQEQKLADEAQQKKEESVTKFLEEDEKKFEQETQYASDTYEFLKYVEDSIAESEAISKYNQIQKDQLHYEQRQEALRYFYDSSLDLVRGYFQQEAQLESQRADERYQDIIKYQDEEKQKRLAQAQSAAEKETIEREYDQKAKQAERERNIERQEIARKQLYIEAAVASLKVWSGQGSFYEKIAQQAVVAGELLLGLKSINSQKFEEGGMPSAGGDISGPSHAFGGVPFNYEAEGGEMAIINKNSTMDKGKYTVSGTPRQIASAINELGGGIRFAPGATAAKFEYGGLLGSNLTAPVMSAPVVTSSMSELSYSQGKAMEQAIDNKIRTLKVTLNPHDVRGFNNDYNKNVNVAVL